MFAKYGGKCDTYCNSINRTCVGAREEQGDSCAVQSDGNCSVSFGTTSDAICECSREGGDGRLIECRSLCGGTRITVVLQHAPRGALCCPARVSVSTLVQLVRTRGNLLCCGPAMGSPVRPARCRAAGLTPTRARHAKVKGTHVASIPNAAVMYVTRARASAQKVTWKNQM